MAIKTDREYRNFNSFELLKRDESSEEEYIVKGYASTFDEYVLFDFGDEKWTERIEPTAFEQSDMTDVVFLRDHVGQVFARTKNNTLGLMVDEHGLFSRTNLSKTSSARAMYEDIEVGNYSQMSFAFTVGDQAFEEEMRDGIRIVRRVIRSIKKIYDVSAVGFPANPNTDIGIATRSAFDGAIKELEAERLREMQEKNERARQILALKMKIS